MSGAIAASCLPVRLQGRINSLQQLHKVRLRGLGGPDVCGVPRTCASATSVLPPASARAVKPRLDQGREAVAGKAGTEIVRG